MRRSLLHMVIASDEVEEGQDQLAGGREGARRGEMYYIGGDVRWTGAFQCSGPRQLDRREVYVVLTSPLSCTCSRPEYQPKTSQDSQGESRVFPFAPPDYDVYPPSQAFTVCSEPERRSPRPEQV
jgi:hypothetical protein